MSRSYRRTPICGMTARPSDEPAKVRAHRAARRALGAIDLTAQDAEIAAPHPRAHGDPWSAPKDGKTRFDPGLHPDLMRK